MSQFDVFHNPDVQSRARIPYVLVLQSDLLDSIENHIVVPLRIKLEGAIVPVLRLNPIVSIDGDDYLLRMQDIAAVPRRLLRQPVTNLSSRREDILAALDFLFTGF